MVKRKLYKIGDMIKTLGVSARTLRYYEQIGLLPHVKRSDGGMRLYTEQDVALVREIRRLKEECYFPLEVIRERLFGKTTQIDQQNQFVVTDSTVLCGDGWEDLPLKMVPFEFMFGEEKIVDDGSFSMSELWRMRKKIGKPPITIAPSVEMFKKTYSLLYDQGIRQVYSVHISSSISSTLAHAKEAAMAVQDKMDVHVIDSKSLGAGLGVLVWQILEAIQVGDSPQVIQSLIAKQASSVGQFVFVKSLDYLMDGGVFPFSGDVNSPLLESLFAFKPLFRLDSDYPDLMVSDCFRTSLEGIEALKEAVKVEIMNRVKVVDKVMIGYTYLREESMAFSNWFHELFPQTKVMTCSLPPVVSTYLGPETLSVSIL